MQIIYPNYYGFNIDKALQSLKADIYLGTFCVKDNYKPIAMFYSSKPDLTKGHKHFPGLFIQDDKVYVTGFEYDDIKEDLKQYALHCLSCGDIIYSVNRHDYRGCSCGKIFVDGGKDYFKTSYTPGSPYQVGILDFVKKKFIVKDYKEDAKYKPKTGTRGRPKKRPSSPSRGSSRSK